MNHSQYIHIIKAILNDSSVSENLVTDEQAHHIIMPISGSSDSFEQCSHNKMSFHFGFKETILFDYWQTNSQFSEF